MPEDDPLSRALDALSIARGVDYRRLRGEILATIRHEGDRAVAVVEGRAATGPDPLGRLAAAALLAWLRDEAGCEGVTRAMRGDIPSLGAATDPTGVWSIQIRAAAIAALGATAATRALEIIALDHESDEADFRQLPSLFGALVRLGDGRAIEPLRRVLVDDRRPAVRTLAADALAALDAPVAPELVRILEDRREDPELRDRCAAALDRLRAAEATPVLRDIVGREDEPPTLRAACARSLTRRDPEAARALVEAGLDAADLELLGAFVSLLGDIGDRGTLSRLEQMASEHPNRVVREEAAKSAASLRAALGASPEGSQG